MRTMRTPAATTVPTSDVTARVRWTPVIVFYVVASALAWLIDLPLWLSGQGLRTPGATFIIAASMFAPGIAAVVVVLLVERAGWRRLLRRIGWRPVRPWRRTIWLAVFGIVGSILLPIVTVFAAGALGFVRLDLVHFSGFMEVLHHATPPGVPLPPAGVLVIAQLAALPLGAVINSFLTVGEETGWRGYLLPSLRPLGTWPALLISGAAWGLWHAPVILLGYNFARPSAAGVGLMVLGCMAYGLLIGWLRIRAGNIWPSVFAHGAFNAAAGFLGLVAAAGTVADPAVVGPLGWLAWVIMAVVAVILLVTHQYPRRNRWADAAPAAPSAAPPTTAPA